MNTPAGAGEKAWRAAILWFDDQQRPNYVADGLLVTHTGADGIVRVLAVGAHQDLAARFTHLAPTHWPDLLLAPGFVDMHIHYPQTDVIGSPADGLLPWLTRYTFVEEARFGDPAHAQAAADFFLDELLRNGVTTALAFASSHPASVTALMQAAQVRHMRLITGKVLQDRHSPDGVRDETEQSLRDTEDLLRRWHGVDRLGYAITPRFAPTCSPAQLHGAGEIARAYPDVWVQSHVSENLDEIRWVQELFPQADSYLGVYAECGLLRERAVYAHCIHFDAHDRALMRERGAAAAVCPTSNLFLGSGFFDFAAADAAHMRYGLASDVGGGTSFSPFHTMLAAYYVGREGQATTGISIPPATLWWQHTAGAAQALGLGGVAGNLLPGCEADFIAINPRATALLARRTAQASNLDELLFALIVLGDDRAVAHTVVQGQVLNPVLHSFHARPAPLADHPAAGH